MVKSNGMRTTGALLLLLASSVSAVWAYAVNSAPEAAEFTRNDAAGWINSEPLTLASLRGRVVMVEFWTFDCGNCRRSIPWVKSVEKQFADAEFSVVAVHTPEFEHERDPKAVKEKVQAYGIGHPVMLDNDYSYWMAMGNRYWPAFYLIDRSGRIRHVFIGETTVGSDRAAEVEKAIRGLLVDTD